MDQEKSEIANSYKSVFNYREGHKKDCPLKECVLLNKNCFEPYENEYIIFDKKTYSIKASNNIKEGYWV